MGPFGELCGQHSFLNHELVDGIFRLIKREVTSHFRQLDAYPKLIEPVETAILHRLRALRGLWTDPRANGITPPDAWPYQPNQCAACVLACIAVNKDVLCNLRVVIQSRTRTRRHQRPRKLTLFVDHCINRFSPNEVEDVRHTADQLAPGMKRARKACVKAYLSDRQIDPSSPSRRKRHQRRHSKRKGGSSQTRTRVGNN